MLIHPSRETRYGMVALGPKGEYLHSRYLHTKFSQYDNNSRVPTCLRVQFTFSASVTVLTTTSVPGFTKNNCNNPSSESHTWPACDTKQLSKFQSKKNMKTNSQQSFLFRFKFGSKQFPLPTQSRSSPLTYYMLCSNTSTTAAQTTDATWRIWEIKTNVPKQAVSTCHFSQSVVNQQSQHQVPPCLQCHDGSYLSLSLSQHSSAYTARQNHNASGFNFKVTSANVHQAPLFLHTTEPQVFNYSRLISHMWQYNSLMNQGHWQSTIWPSRLSCHSFSFLLPPPGMTPGSVAPRTFHSVRPGSTTTWPTCRDGTLSHSTFLISLQRFLVILQALSLSLSQNHQAFQWLSRLSLPKSPQHSLSLVTLQALFAKVTITLSLQWLSRLSLPKSPNFSLNQNAKSHMQRNSLCCSSVVDTYFSHAHHYCQELHRLYLPHISYNIGYTGILTFQCPVVSA